MLLAAVFAAILLALVALRPAEAAFPGGVGRIIFDSSRSGFTEIYSMSPGGEGVTRLVGTNDRNSEANPAVSPDGSRVAYEYGRGIWVMNADGTGQRRLTFTPNAQEHEPAWSPNGARIAYQVSPTSGGTQVYAMNADGTNQINLTPEGRIRLVYQLTFFVDPVLGHIRPQVRLRGHDRRDGGARVRHLQDRAGLGVADAEFQEVEGVLLRQEHQVRLDVSRREPARGTSILAGPDSAPNLLQAQLSYGFSLKQRASLRTLLCSILPSGPRPRRHSAETPATSPSETRTPGHPHT